MAKGKTYRVLYTPDADKRRWNARVDGKVNGTGCATWGRSINETRANMRDALATALEDDVAAEAAVLIEAFDVPAADSLAALRAERAEVDRRAAALTRKSMEEATRLHAYGLSVRDIGALLGISFQRVQQFVGGTRAAPAPAPKKRLRKSA